MKYVKTAAAYIRVSTDEQVEISPESQLVEIKKYAEREGYILPSEYIFRDEGISGKKADKRPDFQRMIATAKENSDAFDVILVWKFSRFARNQEESIFYKSVLKSKCGVDVVSVTEPLIEGPFGSLIERIIEWMDEFYSLRLSQEVKRSMTLNAQRGGRQTIASFGYHLEGSKMVPDETEAPIVRRIFRDFIDGKGFFAIASELNAEGVRTHRGNALENRGIEYILRNPVYIGKLRWNPSGRSRRQFDHPDIILADGEHEPLISSETWEQAQRRIAEVKARWQYKAKPPSMATKFWLQGVLRCAKCGATLLWLNPHYVRCGNYAHGRCKTSQSTRWDVLSEAVLSQMEADTAEGSEINVNIVYSASGGSERRNSAVKARNQALKRLERLKDAYLNGVIELNEYSSTRRSLEAAAAAAEADIAAADKKLDKETILSDFRRSMLAAIEIIKSPDTTTNEKNAAAKSIIETCVYDKTSKTIELFYYATP